MTTIQLPASGKKAFEFQKKFRIAYDISGRNQKFDRPIALLQKVKNDLQARLLNTNTAISDVDVDSKDRRKERR